MNNKVLIIDEFEPTLMKTLREANIPFEYAPYLKREELIQIIQDYSGLVVRSKTEIDREIIDKAKKLLFIARGGSGMDNLDEAYAKTKNIYCLNAPEGNRNAVAEHTVGLLLSLICNISKGNDEINKNLWDREGNRGLELSSMTIGIVGVGNVGNLVAKKLHYLGANVLCYDKYKTDFNKEYIQECTLEEMKEKCNAISFHVPFTKETNGMFNNKFIDELKHPIYLINTSRGPIVHTTSLLKGLDENKVIGAALDVLENEKINELNEHEKQAFIKLQNHSNIILTPHVAGWSKESYIRISKVLSDKIISLLNKSEYFANEVLINLKK